MKDEIGDMSFGGDASFEETIIVNHDYAFTASAHTHTPAHC
jgi:hypothetical protein